MVGTFWATTDSSLAEIKVEAIIKYGKTQIGKIKSQTLNFSGGPLQLEAHFFEDGPNLNVDGIEFVDRYITTEDDIELVLNTTSALQLSAQVTGIATLGVKNLVAWVRGGIITGGAEYSITIKHPLQISTLEITELSFVATVGGDDLLKGKLKNFRIGAGLAEKDTGRHPAELCRNQLTTLWDVTMNSKVDVEITSASVKLGGLRLNGLHFNFKDVDFKVDGPVIGALGAGIVGKLLRW